VHVLGAASLPRRVRLRGPGDVGEHTAFDSSGVCSKLRAPRELAFLKSPGLLLRGRDDGARDRSGASSPLAYSNRARGQRRKAEAELEGHPSDNAVPTPPQRAALRRRWANLIRRVYEVDPLVCPRSGAEMRVSSSASWITSASATESLDLPHPFSPPWPASLESRLLRCLLCDERGELSAGGVSLKTPPSPSPMAHSCHGVASTQAPPTGTRRAAVRRRQGRSPRLNFLQTAQSPSPALVCGRYPRAGRDTKTARWKRPTAPA
jgi:hypothetical protein